MDVFVILVFSEVLNDTKIYYNFFFIIFYIIKKILCDFFVFRK